MKIQQCDIRTTKKILSEKTGFLDWEKILEYSGMNPKAVPFETRSYGVSKWKIQFEDGAFFFANNNIEMELWLQGHVKVKIRKDCTGVGILGIDYADESKIDTPATVTKEKILNTA